MKKGQIKVDKDRVARALFERGLTPVEASKKIYRNSKYFSQLLSDNASEYMTDGTITAINDLLGISYDEIKPLDEPVEQKTEEKPAEGGCIHYPTLERYVHKAVAEAIDNRLGKILDEVFTSPNNEFQKVLGRAVYVGTKKALHEVWNNEEEQR